ncbi:MAG: type I deoxyribonuclease HsdR [Pirellulaceae bacterium]|nr:MAG: type I deoxyribonuclease HsdR [Pirellulaceae bacterium]
MTTAGERRRRNASLGEKVLARWCSYAYTLRPAYSGVFFRIAFGLLMAKWAADYLVSGRVHAWYIVPEFHFTYPGFGWVQPWPGEAMVGHFAGLLVLSLMVALGLAYRVAAALLAVGFTYVFLLDRANYQNHYYLILLISWWLPWMPLNNCWAVDAWWRGGTEAGIPNWTLWMLRFHVGLPYFFGGVAKIDGEWLLGFPLSMMLATKSHLPVVGAWLASPTTAMVLAWVSMLFDLLIVPALLSKAMRKPAFMAAIIFHCANAYLFNIHIFPWMMILATTIFFAPDWPVRTLSLAFRLVGKPTAPITDRWRQERQPEQVPLCRRLAVGLMSTYVAFHCVWPLRHHLYPGDASWTEQGHYFAWRMMLRGKKVAIGYAIEDKVNGRVIDAPLMKYLSPMQAERFARDPELIRQLAHFLGKEYERNSGHAAAVYALVLTSLNGRKPELFVDPNVDLSRQQAGVDTRTWVLSQREPLRWPPWDVPQSQWRWYVEIPELHYLPSARLAAAPSP